MKQSAVIEDLIDKTRYCMGSVDGFLKMDDKNLNRNPSPNSWNVLQNIKHLNLYGDFYLPEFKKSIKKAKRENIDKEFKPGFWGKYFTSMMLPQEGKKMMKMKAFKSKSPDLGSVSKNDLKEFLKQQEKLLDLLEQARSTNLNRNKCKLTLPLIKMNLGATLQFVIFHHVRHIEQAKGAIS